MQRSWSEHGNSSGPTDRLNFSASVTLPWKLGLRLSRQALCSKAQMEACPTPEWFAGRQRSAVEGNSYPLRSLGRAFLAAAVMQLL